VATLAGGTLAAEEFVAQADQALYHSKAAGRNCVTHWLDLAGVAGGAKPE
jgi:GGDEF domain-containing protein